MLQLHTALSRSRGFLAFRICFTANVWLKASQVEGGPGPPKAAQPGISPDRDGDPDSDSLSPSSPQIFDLPLA